MTPLLPLLAMLSTTGPVLQLSVQVTPMKWAHRKQKVEVAVTLKNMTEHPVAVLVGHAGNESYFFDLKLADASGKMLWTADRPRFLATDDLPQAIIQTIPPRGSYRAALDWRSLYNLAPGKYLLSGVYRLEPERAPHADGYYQGEIRRSEAFVGRIESAPVGVTVVE